MNYTDNSTSVFNQLLDITFSSKNIILLIHYNYFPHIFVNFFPTEITIKINHNYQFQLQLTG
jgi:hypothetical protein